MQHVKLKYAKLSKYFDAIITSEQVGVMKPNPKIFEYAIKHTDAKLNESIMIGDDLVVDILSAKRFGIDQIYFNPKKEKYQEKVTFEISSLSQLKEIF